MKVKTTGAIVNGHKLGSIIDLPQKDAKRLIEKGVVEKVQEPKQSAAKKEPTPKKTEAKPQAEAPKEPQKKAEPKAEEKNDTK